MGAGNVVVTHGNHDNLKHFNYVIKEKVNIAHVHGKNTARILPSTTAGVAYELGVVGFGGSEKKSLADRAARAFVGHSIYKYDEIYASVRENLEERQNRGALYDTVLLTHQPVYGVLDRSIFSDNWRKLPEGRSRKGGSKALRDVLEEYAPFLVVSGHIHEDPGIAVREGPGRQPMEAKYDAKGGILDLSKLDSGRLREGGMHILNALSDEVTFGIDEQKRETAGPQNRPTFYINAGSLGYGGVHCDVDLEVFKSNSGEGKAEFGRVVKFKFYNNNK